MQLKWVAPFLFVTTLFAADRTFTPYASARPILDAQRSHLPAELQDADPARWATWSQKEDKAIRARLQQGDLDSMVNLLLLGTSFTKQPRIRVENITEASKSGVLRARVDDLVASLGNPAGNERLDFLSGVLQSRGIEPGASTGVFIYRNLQRVFQERKALAERAAGANPPASLLDRASLFRDRGLSLDTGILPDFSVDQALRDLKTRGVLREGQVARVAVIRPGLDFIDKSEDSGYDYYPQQTVQPFALYDSLVRLGLARANAMSLSVLDISSRVLDHIRLPRERARKNIGYVVQPPRIFQGLETRAVLIRPEVVLACDPVDLNIVLDRRNLPVADHDAGRFDLVVGTNIFVYYDAFEQALALENGGAMLKTGGLLLTNDKLPELAGGSMRLAGATVVRYGERDASVLDAVGWYRKQ
jgi:hypothetical protein